MNGAEENERNREGDAVDQQEHANAAVGGHDLLDQLGEGQFAERA